MRVEITREVSSSPVNTHGGHGAHITWRLLVEGVQVIREVVTVRWEHRNSKLSNVAPGHIQTVADELNAINDELPWRMGDIARGLILFRTSNNASSHVNFEALTTKIEDLPSVAQEELVTLLRNVASDIETRLHERTVPKHEKRHPVLNTFDWHFVQATEQNRNSYKLRGWFPTEELARAHIMSWPSDVSRSMSYIPARDFKGRSDGKKAPEHMQGGVTLALYNFYISQGVFASHFMKLPDGVTHEIEMLSVTRTGTTDAAHVIYGKGDPDASGAIKDANGDIVLGHCMVCGAGEIELEQPCNPDRLEDTADLQLPAAPESPMLWTLQEHSNGAWFNIGGVAKSEDAVERALEAAERADLEGKRVYRYRRIK